MKIIRNQSRKSSQGFTLIEMIGVLAVIAILASMLVPKIFEAINSARINNTVQSYNAIKTGVLDHYGKYGAINFVGIPAPGGATTAAQLAAYDTQVLLAESLIDKPFRSKVGTNWVIHAVAGSAAATAPNAAAGNGAYDLDGDGGAAGTAVNDASPAAFVVEALIQGVAIADAIEISERLDGPTMSVVGGGADALGRVKYAAPVGGLTDVYIYIAHR